MRRIVLYTPAHLVRRGPGAGVSPTLRIRNFARRAIDRLVWRLSGRLVARPYTYGFDGYVNRGDEAIRVVLEQDLRAAIGDDLAIEEVMWGGLEQALREGRIRGADLFVVGGGGYYRFLRNGDLHPNLAADIALFDEIECPMLTYGSGVNYNIRPEQSGRFTPTTSAKSLLTRHLAKLEFCVVRDAFSRDLMQACSPRPIEMTADPVLFLDPRPTPRVPDQTLRVGVNVAFHGPNAASVLTVVLPRIVALLKSLRDGRGARFTYFVHCETEYGIVAMLRDSGITLDVVDGDPRTIADAYAAVDVHLCQMMHSSIMSMRCGVPTLVVAYDQKHHSFFDLMEQSRFCLSVHEATADTLAGRFDELIRGRDLISAAIRHRTAALEVDHRRIVDEIGMRFGNRPARSIG